MSDGGSYGSSRLSSQLNTQQHIPMDRDILPKGPLGPRTGTSGCLEAIKIGIQVFSLHIILELSPYYHSEKMSRLCWQILMRNIVQVLQISKVSQEEFIQRFCSSDASKVPMVQTQALKWIWRFTSLKRGRGTVQTQAIVRVTATPTDPTKP